MVFMQENIPSHAAKLKVFLDNKKRIQRQAVYGMIDLIFKPRLHWNPLGNCLGNCQVEGGKKYSNKEELMQQILNVISSITPSTI